MAKAQAREAVKGGRKSARRPRRGEGRRRSLPVRLLYWAVTAAIWVVIAVGGVAAFYAHDLPDVSGLGGHYRAPGVTVLAANGAVLANYGDVFAGHVDVAELPPELPAAVLATEDRRFYRHFGLDGIGLARALWANLRAGRVVQGGSTITQQVAKNVFLTPARTFKRKAQEVLLALWLEHRFTKDQLLTIYLNRVYLGAGTYGVEAAARRYFAKPAARLDLAESAMIAGLLKAPSRYAPTRNLERAQRRAAQVLDNMVAAGSLDAARAAAAKAQPARLRGGAEFALGEARYFTDWAVEQVAAYVGPARADITVYSTLSPHAQRAAERAVAALPGTEQTALVALANDGAVRAMVGGRSYAASQFNRATQARRQPGSAFKLFVYLAAFEAGLRPDDIVADSPIEVDGWRPRNYADRYRGDITLTEAFAQSSNAAAVRLSEQVGRARVIDVARRLGVASPLADEPSLALGASEVSLLELTGAYAVVANGGHGLWPYGITEIRDRDGRVLYRRQGSGPGRVLDGATAAAMGGLLRAVVARGTGRAAQIDHAAVPVAGKTGTSQDFRDAWFVGYTPELVAGVWLGNDDSRPMDNVTGGGAPARLWRDFASRLQP